MARLPNDSCSASALFRPTLLSLLIAKITAGESGVRRGILAFLAIVGAK
jgi:hypothetical protein